MCSRITQMTPPKPLLSILTPVGLTQSSAAHCMVSTQDLSRVTPSPSSVLTDSVSPGSPNTPRTPPVPLSRKVCRASIWRQAWWRWSRCRPQGSCSHCSPEAVSASSVVCFLHFPEFAFLWGCVCMSIPTFQF